MISFEKLVSVFPKVTQELYNELQIQMIAFGINTDLRQAAFLAQCGHESGGFTIRKENLNYSAKGLLNTFPKRVSLSQASEIERQPEKIANLVYANRMGNGDVNSGDGWKYRGRGFIQLTGKENYSTCGAALGVDILSDPDYLLTDIGAVQSACWFWNSRQLNELADKADIVGITKKINGGIIGLTERKSYFEKLKSNP